MEWSNSAHLIRQENCSEHLGNVSWWLWWMFPLSVMIFLGQGVHQQKPPWVLPLALLRGGCVSGTGQQAAHFCPKIQEQSATNTTVIICYILLVLCRWTETIPTLSTSSLSHHSSYLCIQWKTSPLLLGVWHRTLCQVHSHLCEASLADSSQEIQSD